MKKMLLTSALVAAMGCTVAYGQTTTNDGTYGADIMAPEGFERQDVVLTAEDLLNATVYDSRGDAVGEVEDLVLSTGTSTGQAGAQTGANATTTDQTTAQTGTGTTATGTDSTATGTSTTTDATGTATTGTADTATGTTAGTDMATNNGTAATDGTAAAQTGTSVEGEVTHAVIDVGGFLGIGERRVALPISDLVVYRGNSERRVFLPWTEEQLEELPVYNVNDPATLGQSRRMN